MPGVLVGGEVEMFELVPKAKQRLALFKRQGRRVFQADGPA